MSKRNGRRRSFNEAAGTDPADATLYVNCTATYVRLQ